MITVNPCFIEEVLAPLVGGADREDDFANFGLFNIESEVDVKRLAKDILYPEFASKYPVFKETIKNSLAYYLVYPKVNFEAIYNSILPPFETPKDSYLFFIWIWEAFFPDESFNYIINMHIVEDSDIEAPLKLLKKIRGNS